MWPFSFFFRNKKKLKFSREASFAARPVRNPVIEWDQESDSDELVLTIPRRKSKGTNVVAWVLGVPKERRIQLDELGSFVWRCCDGVSTVHDVVKALMGEYKLSQREATVSLTTYLQTLGKRNLVAFAVERSLVGDGSKTSDSDEVEEEEGEGEGAKNTSVSKKQTPVCSRRRRRK